MAEGSRRLEAVTLANRIAPATVQYNDWRQVAVEPLETFTPTLPVSVVIPSWQTPPETLAMTLAALEGQTCPRDRFEVVIVDDGSEPPLRLPPTPLDVKVVRQERNGGRARARNAGARAAAHDVLLFLDSDVLVERNWIAAHARWHHAVSDAVTVASYADVAMDGIDADTIRRRPGSLQELLSDHPKDPSWMEGFLAGTGDLTARAHDPFSVLTGGNFGIGKGFYELVGGMDESFVRWGLEDTELGYRAFVRGGLLVPVRDTFVCHTGRWGGNRDAERRSRILNLGKAAHRIAHPSIRRRQPGRIFAVPQYVVTIDGRRCPTDRIIGAVVNVLADRVCDDLVVRVEAEGGEGDGDGGRLARLRDEFGPDPRVRVAPERSALDEFPASPFHVTLPARELRGHPVRRLRAELGDAATASTALPDGTRASITRAWALHRARRTGKSPADFGEARTISAGALKLAKRRDPAAPHEEADRPARWNRLRDRVPDVRSPSQAGSFVKWAAGAAWRKAAGAWRQ